MLRFRSRGTPVPPQFRCSHEEAWKPRGLGLVLGTEEIYQQRGEIAKLYKRKHIQIDWVILLEANEEMPRLQKQVPELWTRCNLRGRCPSHRPELRISAASWGNFLKFSTNMHVDEVVRGQRSLWRHVTSVQGPGWAAGCDSRAEPIREDACETSQALKL